MTIHFRTIAVSVLSVAMSAIACGAASPAVTPLAEITDVPEKAGGIYYAYPVTSDSLPPLPEGYVPVCMSHYGRHGSRWAINKAIYERSLLRLAEARDADNLTEEGMRLLVMANKCADNAKGHYGELSQLGTRQHRDIAGRMVERFPQLFTDGAVVNARASEVPRCVVSMASFLTELTRRNPRLSITMASSPGGMDTLALAVPDDMKHLMRDYSKDPRREHYYSLRDSITKAPHTAARIFRNPDMVSDLPLTMRDIYDMAIAVQDVDNLDADILSLFDAGELTDMWKNSNYNHYMEHGNIRSAWAPGPRSAAPLLEDIIVRADASLAGRGAPVELRFGHDTVLMRLLALMGAEGCFGSTDDMDKAAEQWRNYFISPMGANLQMAFSRNGEGRVIVSLRLNEQPLKITGLTESFPGYYDWTALRSHLLSAIHPVSALVERVSPGRSSGFLFVQTDSNRDYFELSQRDGRVLIEGNNPVNIAAGLNWYLKYHAGVHLGWNNMRCDLPEALPLPRKAERRETDLKQRYYLNYCTHSYSMAFWDFDRWQQEIDWMALHGINMPLAITGTDVVWRNTLLRLGYSDAEADAFVAGPAFQAWWLMNNLEGWGGPNSPEWYADRERLQKDILRAMNEYGMTPVLPGYSGMVPHDGAERLGVKASATGDWNGFTRPAFMSTTDPMFDRIADIYYDELAKVSGVSKYYSMDPFHEGGNAEGVDLKEAGGIIAKAMKRANPEAVWVIQGWNENPRAELLDGVGKGDIVVLDLASEIKPNWGDPDSPSLTRRPDGYAPHDWMFCMLLNFGGNVGLHGRMDNVIEGFYKARSSRYNESLTGIGLTPEGIENNPVMYELVSELVWRPEKFSKEEWLRGYAKARYGATDGNVDKAWRILAGGIYNCPWGNMQQGTTESVFCARPSRDVWQVSSWSRMAPYYDGRDVIKAAKEFAKGASRLRDNVNYRYDLVDITRQAVAEKGRLTYREMTAALDRGDAGAFDKASRSFLKLIDTQDGLLATCPGFSVNGWIESARSLGHSASEKDLMESNARYLITTWGPRAASEEGGLRDYAHREWHGVLGSLYRERWSRWIEACRRTLEKGTVPDKEPDIDFFDIDERWVRSRGTYPARPASEAVEASLRALRDL